MANTSEMPVKEQSSSQQATAETSTNADKEYPVFTTKTERRGSDSNESAISVGKMQNPFQKKPFVIGVAGGTASGKSTVCSKIMDKLGPNSSAIYNEKRVICISQDSFYRKMTEEDRSKVEKGNFNFDHPSAFDVNLLVRTLREVQNGRMVKVPVYNYVENQLGSSEEVIYPADVVLVEGLLLFYFPEVREMFHMKIFVDTDPDTRLSRRVMRDVNERHRGLDVVLSQYTKFVKPSFEEFCLPTKKYADIIVPRGPDNEVAVDLIVTHVQSIFDPSIRHQSIKYYHEEPIHKATKPTTKGSKKSKVVKGANFAVADKYPVEANVVNGKCVTPMINGNYKSDDNSAQRSDPIRIKNDGSSSPLLRNGFSSSSAPSHLNGFLNGFDNYINQNGHTNGAIHSEEDSDDSLSVFEDDSSSMESSPSLSKVIPPRTLQLASPSKAMTSGKAATGSNSQPQQSTAPILLVASR